MPSTLMGLSADVISAVLELLEYDTIGRLLYTCGDKSFYSWISRHHLLKKLAIDNTSSALLFCTLQRVPVDISALRILSIQLPREHLPVFPLWTGALPRTLVEIRFSFATALEVWLRPIVPDDTALFRLVATICEGTYTVENMEKRFPCLKVLHLSNDPTRSGDKTTTWNNEMCQLFLKNLPESITSLHLPYMSHIPPHLITPSSSSLIHLSLGSCNLINVQETLNKVRHTLKHLVLGNVSPITFDGSKNEKPSIVLPSTLESLELESQTGATLDFSFCRQSLTKLKLCHSYFGPNFRCGVTIALEHLDLPNLMCLDSPWYDGMNDILPKFPRLSTLIIATVSCMSINITRPLPDVLTTLRVITIGDFGSSTLRFAFPQHDSHDDIITENDGLEELDAEIDASTQGEHYKLEKCPFPLQLVFLELAVDVEPALPYLYLTQLVELKTLILASSYRRWSIGSSDSSGDLVLPPNLTVVDFGRDAIALIDMIHLPSSVTDLRACLSLPKEVIKRNTTQFNEKIVWEHSSAFLPRSLSSACLSKLRFVFAPSVPSFKSGPLALRALRTSNITEMEIPEHWTPFPSPDRDFVADFQGEYSGVMMDQLPNSLTKLKWLPSEGLILNENGNDVSPNLKIFQSNSRSLSNSNTLELPISTWKSKNESKPSFDNLESFQTSADLGDFVRVVFAGSKNFPRLHTLRASAFQTHLFEWSALPPTITRLDLTSTYRVKPIFGPPESKPTILPLLRHLTIRNAAIQYSSISHVLPQLDALYVDKLIMNAIDLQPFQNGTKLIDTVTITSHFIATTKAVLSPTMKLLVRWDKNSIQKLMPSTVTEAHIMLTQESHSKPKFGQCFPATLTHLRLTPPESTHSQSNPVTPGDLIKTLPKGLKLLSVAAYDFSFDTFESLPRTLTSLELHGCKNFKVSYSSALPKRLQSLVLESRSIEKGSLDVLPNSTLRILHLINEPSYDCSELLTIKAPLESLRSQRLVEAHYGTDGMSQIWSTFPTLVLLFGNDTRYISPRFSLSMLDSIDQAALL